MISEEKEQEYIIENDPIKITEEEKISAKSSENTKPGDKISEDDSSKDAPKKDDIKAKFAAIEAKIKEKYTPVSSSLYRFAGTQEMIFLVIGNFFSFVVGAIVPLVMVFFGEILDSLAKQRENMLDAEMLAEQEGNTWLLIVGNFAGGIFGVTNYFIWYFFLVWAKRGIIQKFRAALFRALIHRDYSFWAEFKPQEITQFIENELTYFEKGINEKTGTLYLSMSLIVCGLTYCLVTSWLFSLVLLFTFMILISSVIFFLGQIQKHSALKTDALKYLGGLLEEIFYSVKTVYYLDAKDWVINRYEQQCKKVTEHGVNVVTWTSMLMATFMGCFGIYLGFGMSFGYYLLSTEDTAGWIPDMSAGQVITIIFLTFMIVTTIFGSTVLIKDVLEAHTHVWNLYYIIDHTNIIADSPESIESEIPEVNISVEDVIFKYSDREEKNTLDCVNMQFKAHQITSIVGESGSGKSTLVKILSRFYQPQSGNVKWNGVDIKDYKIKHLRDHIGYVNQDPVFFDFSLRDNMRLSFPEASDVEILNVIQSVNLKEWYKKQEFGLDTKLGMQGSKLSGGEKQRLSIARALLKPKLKLLLLDEATAALDYKTEKIIYETIFKVQAELKFTCIIIAHRLKSIKKSDYIYVMSRGQLLEEGNHDTLLANNGLYYSLVNSQENKTEDVDMSIHHNEDYDKKKSVDIHALDEKEINVDKVTNTADNMELFNIYDFTKKLIDLNSENINHLRVGVVACFFKGFFTATQGYWYANIIIILLLGGEDSFNAFVFNAGIYISYIFFTAVIDNIKINNMGRYSEHLIGKLKCHIIRALLDYKLIYLQDQEYSPGNLATIFSSDIEKIKSAGGEYIGEVVALVVGMTIAISVALVIDWAIPAALVVVIPLYYLSFSGENKKMRQGGMNDYSKIGLVSEDSIILSESSVNWMTTQSLGGEEIIIDKYVGIISNDGFTCAGHACTSLRFGLSNGSNFFAQGAMFLVMFIRLREDPTRLQNLIRALFIIFLAIMGNLNSMSYLGDIEDAAKACKKIFAISENASKRISHTEEELEQEITEIGEIEFKDVGFCYVEGAEVFKHLNFKVEKNKFNALCGYSGGGKSTILNMMLKLYEGQKGQVLVGGKDIKSFKTSSILHKVGYVGQDSLLFDETIEDNINIGLSETLAKKDFLDLIKKVNASDVYDVANSESTTRHLGLKGCNVSGGQRQRLAIARALARNNLKPSLLILDEATASLDGKNEEEIQKVIEAILKEKNCTILVVAHRLSTIKNADAINVLANGEIMERGTHEELMNIPGGIYRGMQNS